MKTFTDTAGRTWTVAINVDAIKRVRSLTKTDLLAIVEGELVERLMRDPVLLCDVIYAACKPEADARNVTDEEFGRAMAGDAIEAATVALLDELVAFCPNPRDRANLGRVLATTRTWIAKAQDLLEQKIANGELDRIAAQALKKSMSSSGDLPASWGSTPDGSPSVN